MKAYVEMGLHTELPNFIGRRGSAYCLRLIGIDLVLRTGDYQFHPIYQPLFTIIHHTNGVVIELPASERTTWINLQTRWPFIQAVRDLSVYMED
jgi:hypothetical protein